MKHNKILIASFIGFFGLFSQITAKDPNFDILNKTDKPIRLTLELHSTLALPNRGRLFEVFRDQEVKPMGGRFIFANHFSKDLDLKNFNQVILTVTYGDNFKEKKFAQINITENKTIYVSFGKKDYIYKIYPQTGIAGGIFGKSEVGYSLDNNITSADIADTRHIKKDLL